MTETKQKRPLPPEIEALIEHNVERWRRQNDAREDLIKACLRYAEASTTSLLQAIKGHHDGRTKEVKALSLEVRESLAEFEATARRWVQTLDEEQAPTRTGTAGEIRVWPREEEEQAR